MKHFLFFTLFLILSVHMYPQEDSIQKDLRLLVLIVATDQERVYAEAQKIWRSYMHLDPDHVEAYFLKANPDLPTDYVIEGDIIWCRTTDTRLPGITNKILMGLEYMKDRLKEFDYVLRASVTTFYAFPRLLKYLKTAPRSKCYCGPLFLCGDSSGGVDWGGFYYGGPGLIFSRDVTEFLIESKDLLFNNTNLTDDTLISCLLLLNNISMIPTPMILFPNIHWWWTYRDILPENVFHFAVGHDHPSEYYTHFRSNNEIYIYSELAKKIYGVTCPIEIDNIDFALQETLWRTQERPWGRWKSLIFSSIPE